MHQTDGDQISCVIVSFQVLEQIYEVASTARNLRITASRRLSKVGHQTPQEEELRRLKRELEVTRQERDILKKALAIFSRNQP
jgi:transposase-like protein